MVDEPELNLHPENQRRVARLFARLINLGIKVFITTHSDYIVKELKGTSNNRFSSQSRKRKNCEELNENQFTELTCKI
jgi:predicted ATPase